MQKLSKRTTFTFELTNDQQELLLGQLVNGNYKKIDTPYSIWSVEGDRFIATLYEKERHSKRKFLVQGAGAEDFVLFVLEPLVLRQAGLGYEKELNPELLVPHLGSDESGKGDYYGPLVVTAAYCDEKLYDEMKTIGVKDCKQMTDRAVLNVAAKLKKLLGPRGYNTLKLMPPAYNRLYAKIGNVNRLLAWAHATVIENLLEARPDCKRVVIDQFAASEAVILRALKPRAKEVEVVQRHKAENDMAVAAASVLARAEFLAGAVDFPHGSSDPSVALVARENVTKFGPKWILNNAKAHFQTTDKVLEACGFSRDNLPEEGRIRSRLKQAFGTKKSEES